MRTKTKGVICGIIAAISYGTNPLGALSLYEEGISVNSVLFYRYSFAALILGFILLTKREQFYISKKEIKLVAALGVLFATSSLTLFTSFHFMDAGIASTILFIYPIMVALIMAFFFKERISMITTLSIFLALSGIAMLYSGGDNGTLSGVGVVLVLVSALTYALYIIVINRADLKMSSFKLTFYVLLFCILTIVGYALASNDPNNSIQLLTTTAAWSYAIMLAIVPTVISLVTMAIAVKLIGSTPTAIMGALEPLTAVVIGVTIFNEVLTLHLMIGILMILFAVILIISADSIKQSKLLSPLQKIHLKIKHH